MIEREILAKSEASGIAGYRANLGATEYQTARVASDVTPERAITIPVCIELFEKVAAQLHDSIANLEARLAFVLRSAPEQKVSPDSIPTSSDIASRLVRLAEIINHGTGRINGLNHRLDF